MRPVSEKARHEVEIEESVAIEEEFGNFRVGYLNSSPKSVMNFPLNDYGV